LSVSLPQSSQHRVGTTASSVRLSCAAVGSSSCRSLCYQSESQIGNLAIGLLDLEKHSKKKAEWRKGVGEHSVPREQDSLQGSCMRPSGQSSVIGVVDEILVQSESLFNS
jgi:hypothetical protein